MRAVPVHAVLASGVLAAALIAGYALVSHAEPAQPVSWSQQAGEATVFPACGSASVSGGPTCNADGTAQATISWDVTGIHTSSGISQPIGSCASVSVTGPGGTVAGLPCVGSYTSSPLSPNTTYTFTVQGGGYDSYYGTYAWVYSSETQSISFTTPACSPQPPPPPSPGGPVYGTLTLSPNPASVCPTTGTAVINVTGNANVNYNVYIRQTGDLFASKAANDPLNKDTGNWVTNGMIFDMKNAATGELLYYAQETFTCSLPDLTASGVSINPVSPSAGSNPTLSAIITNLNYAPTTVNSPNTFQVDIFSDGTVDANYDGTETPPLGSGGSATVSTNNWGGIPAGRHLVRACADTSSYAPSGTVAESNENNNCGPWTPVTVGQPDLTAGATTATPNPAGTTQAISFSAPVSNIGTATASNFKNIFKIMDSSFTTTIAMIPATTISSLSPGGSATITGSISPLPAGTYKMIACADNDTSWVGTVAESNENNNCGPWGELTVSALPDLEAWEDTTSYPSAPTTADSIHLHGHVPNYGAGAVGNATFPNIFQVNNASNGGGSTIKTVAVSASGPINAYAGSGDPDYVPKLPGYVDGAIGTLPAGNYSFRFCSNTDTSFNHPLVESDTSNNCNIWINFTVATPPTASLSTSPDTVNAGSACTLYWSSANAASCTGIGFSTGGATSGNVSTGALMQTTSYQVTCSGPGGTSAPATATCTVIQPSATMSCVPERVSSGDSSTCTWSSAATGACTESGPGLSSATQSGSQVVTVVKQQVYTISCQDLNGGSPINNSATVNVLSQFQEF